MAFPSSLYDASSWDRKDLSRMVLGGELRMNLATALEAGGDPKGTLVELVRARWALRRQRWRELPGGVDREALVSVLSNAASIASRPFYGRRPVRSS